MHGDKRGNKELEWLSFHIMLQFLRQHYPGLGAQFMACLLVPEPLPYARLPALSRRKLQPALSLSLNRISFTRLHACSLATLSGKQNILNSGDSLSSRCSSQCTSALASRQDIVAFIADADVAPAVDSFPAAAALGGVAVVLVAAAAAAFVYFRLQVQFTNQPYHFLLLHNVSSQFHTLFKALLSCGGEFLGPHIAPCFPAIVGPFSGSAVYHRCHGHSPRPSRRCARAGYRHQLGSLSLLPAS